MGIIEKMRLDGKKGFVTGGARGIGKSVATALCEAGADLAIVDMDLEEAQKTAEWLAAETGRSVIAIKTEIEFIVGPEPEQPLDEAPIPDDAPVGAALVADRLLRRP